MVQTAFKLIEGHPVKPSALFDLFQFLNSGCRRAQENSDADPRAMEDTRRKILKGKNLLKGMLQQVLDLPC
jgi:hypothetical protein